MLWFFAAGSILLLLFLLCREISAKRHIQRELKQITEKLQNIQDTNSGEVITVFTAQQTLMDLAAQINRLLAVKKQLDADFRHSEAASKKMLSNISHDMKTPMTVLLGYLEIMRLKGADPKLLEKTEKKAQSLMELINEFFTLAKLEAGDMELELSRLDICELCRESMLEFYEVLTEQGFAVEAVIPEQPVFVWGNREALQRILSNLISNAVRYGASGQYLSVVIRAEEKQVCVEVMDKGKGIDPVFAESVFDRLFTMEDSRSRRVQGNGLGLTIARNLAEQMGGTLTLQSHPYVSTVFSLKLPL